MRIDGCRRPPLGASSCQFQYRPGLAALVQLAAPTLSRLPVALARSAAAALAINDSRLIMFVA